MVRNTKNREIRKAKKAEKAANLAKFNAFRNQMFFYSFIVFFIPFFFYSPNHPSFFLLFESFTFTFFFSAALAVIAFYLGLFIFAETELPPNSVKIFNIHWAKDTPFEHHFSFSSNNHHHHKRDDWYNDVTNPVSPVYQIVHNQHSSSSNTSSSSSNFSSSSSLSSSVSSYRSPFDN